MAVPKCTPIALDYRMFTEQRQRLAGKMGKPAPEAGEFALYQGGSEVHRNWSDTCYSFRQDSYFFHLFGVEIADCLAAVDLATGEGIIFIPRLPDEYAVWMGKLPTCDDVKRQTLAEHVHYVDEVAAVLKAKGCKTLHVLDGTCSDSGIKTTAADSFKGVEDFTLVRDKLWLVHTEQRTTKTAMEQEYFAKLNKVASAGHVHVMQHAAKVGHYENQLEAAFLGYVMSAAQCKCLAYGAIAAGGRNPAILHYVDNNQRLDDGAMILVDFGGELHCFASDITCSYPVNGKFTPEQAAVYNGVLAAHDAVVDGLKPGVSWVDLHLLAMRTIARALRDDLGLLKGSDEEIEASGLMAAFMPHGLGHLIGLEVHDVGGYMPHTPARGTTPMTSKVRTARVAEEGLMLTIEPGCYFNAVTLEAAFANPKQAPLLNETKLRESVFWNFGGVRIESNVVVTGTGCRNFTNVPRKVEDVEAVMAGTKQWPQEE